MPVDCMTTLLPTANGWIALQSWNQGGLQIEGIQMDCSSNCLS